MVRATGRERIGYSLRCVCGLGFAFLLSFPFAVYGADAPGAFVSNPRWGFRVRAPKNWTHAALSADEEWIASKSISTRPMRAATEGGWYTQVPAEMWVVGFPHVRAEERRAKREHKADGTRLIFKNPYRDYKDFLKRERWFVGGGYHFTEEKETEIKGVKVIKYEILIDKMVRAPLRMKTWVFHYDDIDFAVQFKILDNYYHDYRVTFTECLRSFRRVARTKSLPGGGTTGKREVVDVVDERDLTPEERMQRRHEKVERTILREIENLPSGWYDLRSKNYIALSNTDKKYTQRALSHAEAVRRYLEKKFGNLGTDYVPKGIIRVFNTWEEEKGFGQGTAGLYTGATQVLITKRHGAGKDFEFKFLSRKVTSQWLSFKNLYFTASMPRPIYTGLLGYMGFARSKGKKLSFSPSTWDKQRLRDLVGRGEALPIKNLFVGSSGIFTYDHTVQAGSVVQFLMTKGGPGKWKGILAKYLENLITETVRAEEEFDKLREEARKQAEDAAEMRSANDGGEGEDEEDEEGAAEDEIEKLFEALKKKTQVIRERTFQKTFGKFKDSDWRRLDLAWRKSVG